MSKVRNDHLDRLRDLNNGYNPEHLDEHDDYEIIDKSNSNILVILNKVTNEKEEWKSSSARSEAEYIERWPKRFSLIYKNKFYYKLY